MIEAFGPQAEGKGGLATLLLFLFAIIGIIILWPRGGKKK